RLAQRKLLDLVRADRPVTAEALVESVAQKGAVSLEATVARADGRTHHVEVGLSRIEPETPARYVAVLHDISFSREQFRRYEAFLERLLDDLPVEVALLSPEGKYQYLNPAVIGDRRVREWLVGKTDFEFCEEYELHPEVALRRRSY